MAILTRLHRVAEASGGRGQPITSDGLERISLRSQFAQTGVGKGEVPPDDGHVRWLAAGRGEAETARSLVSDHLWQPGDGWDDLSQPAAGAGDRGSVVPEAQGEDGLVILVEPAKDVALDFAGLQHWLQ